ncbi:MAG: alpha/beta fold hydrolase [Verrucomicrobiota bacterium]
MTNLEEAVEKIELEWLGRTVHTVRFPRDGECKGTVLILHGLGDHIGRYGWAVKLLHEHEFDVLGIDWPGGGQSSGIRGDLPLVDDACRLVEEVLETLNVSPVGVLGHSTGGFFLTHCLAKRLSRLASLRWVWFSSPLLDPSYRQNPLKIATAKVLAKLFPTFTLSTGVSPRDCFHTLGDPVKREFAEGVHDRISLRFGQDLLDPTKKAELFAPEIDPDLSLLITQGADDHVCPPAMSELFLRSFKGEDTTFLIFAGARHEPFREPENSGFFNHVRTWMSNRDS